MFPTTGILDAFNRANEGPPMTGWTDSIAGMQIVSNQTVGNAAPSVSYFSASTYGPNAEIHATIATKPAAGVQVVLFYFDPVTFNGYGTFLGSEAGTDFIGLYRYDAGSPTIISIVAQELADGEKLGYRRLDNTHTSWLFTGGVWVEVGSASDSTYTAAMRVGILIEDITTILDDFGGGTVVQSIDLVVPVYQFAGHRRASMVASGFVPPNR